MGISRHTYLGPYVVVREEMVPTPHQVRGCPTCQSEQFDPIFKFCTKCGAFFTQYPKTTLKPKVDSWSFNVSPDFRLCLAQPSCALLIPEHPIFIPNVSWGNARETDVSPSDFQGEQSFLICSFYPGSHGETNRLKSVELEVEAFTKFFASELAILLKAYTFYEVRWGLLSWSS